MIFCFTDVSKINCKVWRKRFFLCWYLQILMEFYEDILFHIIVVAQNCIEKYMLCETSCTSVFFKLSFIIIFFLLKQYTFVRICMRYILKEVSGQVYTSDSKANIFKIYWDLPSWICMHTLHRFKSVPIRYSRNFQIQCWWHLFLTRQLTYKATWNCYSV